MHKDLISLTLKTSPNFKKNLTNLLDLIKKAKNNSIILAPEVILSDFCYEKLDEASKFSKLAKRELLNASINKTISLTLIEKQTNYYFNNAYIFHNKKVVYKRAKNNLFTLGNEHKYFKTNTYQTFNNTYKNIIEIDNLKIGILICFELRFIENWLQLKGCDIILIPAMWGKQRIENFRALSIALAISNQCFVVGSNGANMLRDNFVITPFGEVKKDRRKVYFKYEANLLEIDKMRRYIVM